MTMKKLECDKCPYERDCIEADKNAKRLEKDVIKEIMNEYDKYRELWVKEYGSDKGFNEWFTQQTNQAK